MRFFRLFLIVVFVIAMALCVQENAQNLADMSIFGQTIFSNISTPIVVFVSVLVGVALAFPLAALSHGARVRRKEREEKEREEQKKQKTDANAGTGNSSLGGK